MLLIGLVIMVLTLRFSHVRASYASVGSFDPPQTRGELNLGRILESDLPGSLPYTWQRGWERAEMLWLTESEKPAIWLERIGDRIHSAQLAAQAGQDEQAFSTYLKAFGYLHQTAHACFATGSDLACDRIPLTAAANRLAESLDRFAADTASDAYRARVEGLGSQIQSLRQQFQF